VREFVQLLFNASYNPFVLRTLVFIAMIFQQIKLNMPIKLVFATLKCCACGASGKHNCLNCNSVDYLWF